MKYRCVIIDDEALARELVATHLSHFEELELVATCSTAIEARRLDFSTIDLLFLDIEMPVLKGTDFLAHLTPKPAVIFTTAYRDYAVEGFNLDAVDYLLKPITFHRFFKAVEKFLKLQTAPNKRKENQQPLLKDFIFIRKDRKQVKLFLSNILYIESLKDYIQIHQIDQKHTIKHSLTQFAQLLDERFLRIHRSFIVNTNQVTAYTKRDVEIGSLELPIGLNYRAVVEEFFERVF
ncbi:MAG: response regulator transcription factor [Bacteroidota bacterium]